jgi:hypothetical protein
MTHLRGDAARETADRFVRAIAEHVPAERVAEVYLFPPLRQGPIESGVAVVAVTDASYDAPVSLDEPLASAEMAGSSTATGTPADLDSEHDAVHDAVHDATDHGDRITASGDRHVVYTATYRHTRKGPERGAWTVEVVAQADAPLDAVAAAVRGVHRRAGDGDGSEADRLSGTQFRALLADAPGPEATIHGVTSHVVPSGPTRDAGYAADAAAADREGRGGSGDSAGSSASSAGGGEGTA